MTAKKSLPAGRRGFTLIELLIVIAILGVLAAGVVTAINPLKRIQQANDAKVKNDIGQIATAEQAYFTTNQVYAASTLVLKNSEDLKIEPVPPTTSYTYTVTCRTVNSVVCAEVVAYGTLKAGLATNSLWCWDSGTGTASDKTACP